MRWICRSLDAIDAIEEEHVSPTTPRGHTMIDQRDEGEEEQRFSSAVTLHKAVSRHCEERSRQLDETVLMAVLGAALLAFFMLLGERCTKDAVASTPSCETIKNADKRNYCRAKTTGSPTWCSFIKDPDTRAMCRIEVKK